MAVLIAVFILIPFNVKSMTPTQRTQCLVYARVVGYLSPINQWNKGKKAEYADRKYFDSALNNNLNSNEANNN